MKRYIALTAVLVSANGAFAQLSVSNPDFTDIDWWTAGGGMGSAAIAQTDSDGPVATNPIENSLGSAWRSNPFDVPFRDGGRAFLLGGDYSPTTGRDDFASLALRDNSQIYTYLGQADSTGTVTVEWSTALRSDSAIPQDNIAFQFQTSDAANYGGTFSDAGAFTSYSDLSIVASDTAWQTVQYTSNEIAAGAHVYIYWFAQGGGSQQTLIQDISVVPEPSSFALLAGLAGMAYLGVSRRRRRK